MLAVILMVAAGSTVAAKQAKPAKPTPTPSKAALSFTPAAHDFGRVAEGVAVTRTFTLTNTGRAATGRLTTRLTGPDALTVTGDACRSRPLRPGRSCTIVVRFAPTEAASVSATLVAAAGTHHRVTARASISGTGTELGATEDAGRIYWADQQSGTIDRTLVASPAPETVVGGQAQPAGVAVSISHVYWTSGGRIMRSDLDGTNVKAIVTGQSGPYGLAVDGGSLYWSNPGDGTIWRAARDGSGAQAVATGQASPQGVAVDATHLYWANSQDGSIWRAGLDGSGAEAIRNGEAVPYGIAVTGTRLYWTGSADGSVWSADLDGSNPQQLVQGQTFPLGIAVGADAIYYSDGATGTITRAGLDGSAPQVIAQGQGQPQLLAYAPPVPTASLYWPQMGAGTINASDLDGGNPRAIVTGQGEPPAVVATSRYAFWTDGDDTVFRAYLDGTDVVPLVQNITGGPQSVAVDGTWVYWANNGDGTIWRTAQDGSGSPQRLVTGADNIFGLAVDATHLYWTDPQDFKVWRAGLDGSGATAIATDQAFPQGIAVDPDHLYWATVGDQSIWRSNLDGTGAKALVTLAGVPSGVAVTTDNLFWSESGAGTITRAALDGTGGQVVVSGQNQPYLIGATPPPPAELAASPATFDFGQVGTDESATQTFTLTNQGGEATGALTAAVTGAPGFTVTAGTCAGVSMAPGASCTVTVRFAPVSAGALAATLAVTSQSTPASADIALSGTGEPVRAVYWTTDADNQPGATGGVSRIRPDGTGATTLVPGLANATGVAANSTSLFWIDGDTIFVADRDGTNRRALISGQVGAQWLAIDDAHIYWTILPDSPPGTVWRAGLDGTGRQQIGTGGQLMGGVAVNATHVYWASSTSFEPGHGTITRANLDGTGAQDIATGQDGAMGVAVDDDFVYWASSGADGNNDDEVIIRANLDGTGAQAIIGGINPIGVASDGNQILWTDGFRGTVNAASRGGGGQHVIIGGQASAMGIALGPEAPATG